MSNINMDCDDDFRNAITNSCNNDANFKNDECRHIEFSIAAPQETFKKALRCVCEKIITKDDDKVHMPTFFTIR